FEADLTGADLTGADLTGADLHKAILDGIIGADFTSALNVPDCIMEGGVPSGDGCLRPQPGRP
ncbi:MAG: pentapeptide repeat-containing protein, partial [Chloroflexota bacterium]|nr:pentapeptide repeat-containing protein [Chloroflexota bacterium]